MILLIKKIKPISNKKLAEILDSSPSFVSALSKGGRKLNIDHIYKFFSAIDFTKEEKEKILLNYYLQDAPEDFKNKIFEKLNN